MRGRYLFFILFIVNNFLFAQDKTIKLKAIRIESESKIETLQDIEEKLLQILKKQANCKDEKCLSVQNERFKNFFQTAYQKDNKRFFLYPFLKLQKKIKVLISADQKVRIFNWSVQNDNGIYQFFAYLMIQKSPKDFHLIELKDMPIQQKQNVKTVEQKLLNHKNWYGALYAQIITKKIDQNIYYFLIGWDGHQSLVHRKVLDVLSIQGESAAFGAPLFYIHKKEVRNRIIVEFMPKVSVALNYEPKLEAILMDQLESWTEYTDINAFRIPTGNFNLLIWKKKGFYLLENFEGNQVAYKKIIDQKYKEKFLIEEAVFVPKIDSKKTKSPKAI